MKTISNHFYGVLASGFLLISCARTLATQSASVDSPTPVTIAATVAESSAPAGIPPVPLSEGPFQMPALEYEYAALEPHIDAKTMQIHYERHHAGYTRNLNAAVEGTEMASMSIEDILASVSQSPAVIRNNGGGYLNHNLFFGNMNPHGSTQPSDELPISAAIRDQFGSFDAFAAAIREAAGIFGSGWVWLIWSQDNRLEVTSTSNQDNPRMDVVDRRGVPLLALDVWEHAYYLNYQNRRADYVSAFFQVIHWPEVNRRYLEAIQTSP